MFLELKYNTDFFFFVVVVRLIRFHVGMVRFHVGVIMTNIIFILSIVFRSLKTKAGVILRA